MKDKEVISTHIQLSPETWEWLKIEAAKQRTTMVAVIRDAIDFYKKNTSIRK